MNLLLAGASPEELALVEKLLGEGVQIGVLADQPTDVEWPLAVVLIRDGDDPLQIVRSTREKVGSSTLLVAISEATDLDPADLLEAGVDDLATNLEALLARHPFLSRRLKQRAQRQLRLEAIMENTVDGIVVIDQQGSIQSVNQAVTRIFGYTTEELLGRNVTVLMPEPYHSEHDGYIRNYLGSRKPQIIGIGREVSGRRKNGEVFPMDLAVSEARLDDHSLFAGVIRDISERRRLENEVLRASEEERRRIGQDLHDGLGQMLTGIGLIARNVGRRLRDSGSPVAGDVEEVVELIREADEQARLLARGLVPVELDRDGLAAALDRLCTKAQRLFGGICLFERDGTQDMDDVAAAANIYRIAQEAVSNAFKHGRADRVRVMLHSDSKTIRLQVLDNGTGFPLKLPEDRGMGVRIMHYRASVIGGQLKIGRLEGGGSVVSCEIPRQGTTGSRSQV